MPSEETLNRFQLVTSPPWVLRPRIACAAFVALVAAFGAPGIWASGVALPLWFSALVIAPLLEEIVFRAGLHEIMLRNFRTRAAANVLTALCFALAHIAVRSDPSSALVALPALAIGWLYERTRRVRDCVTLHAAMNLLWLALTTFA